MEDKPKTVPKQLSSVQMQAIEAAVARLLDERLPKAQTDIIGDLVAHKTVFTDDEPCSPISGAIASISNNLSTTHQLIDMLFKRLEGVCRKGDSKATGEDDAAFDWESDIHRRLLNAGSSIDDANTRIQLLISMLTV